MKHVSVPNLNVHLINQHSNSSMSKTNVTNHEMGNCPFRYCNICELRNGKLNSDDQKIRVDSSHRARKFDRFIFQSQIFFLVLISLQYIFECSKRKTKKTYRTLCNIIYKAEIAVWSSGQNWGHQRVNHYVIFLIILTFFCLVRSLICMRSLSSRNQWFQITFQQSFISVISTTPISFNLTSDDPGLLHDPPDNTQNWPRYDLMMTKTVLKWPHLTKNVSDRNLFLLRAVWFRTN